MQLPKPSFQACDETSLRIHWSSLPEELRNKANEYSLVLQYKEVFQPWEEAQDYQLASTNTSEMILTEEANIVDLKPGTPYSVRLVAKCLADNSLIHGPEAVFDTKPVDCTPRKGKKKCVIS